MYHRHAVTRFVLLLAFIGLGAWLVTRPATPTPEGLARTDALRALAPAVDASGKAAENAPAGLGVEHSVASPVVVNLNDVAVGPSASDPWLEKYLRGEIDLHEIDGPISETEFLAQVRESLRQGVDRTAQVYDPFASVNGTLNLGASFKTIDYTQSQQGVPPDPEIMVGTNHVVVSVNTSFQVFDKNGVSLYGPVLFETFWGGNCGTGSANMVLFDPFSTYDESANRYVLGITGYDSGVSGGNNGYACIAVSQTDSATGSWYLYSFDGNPGSGSDYFFDYPHIGTGQSALYLAANMFNLTNSSFIRNHVFAFDKADMYAGVAAGSVKVDVSSAYFTLQPADLKGYANGGWPTNGSEPHYFLAASFGSGQTQLQVFQFNDPWGTPSVTLAGTVTVNSYNLPVSQPQLGSSGQLQGNDNRMLDAEYWGGRLWGTHTIGCNPGSGTVNCVRWYEINISSGPPSLVQQGTFSTNSEYRSFPDLAVNSCGDMLVGYTKTSTSIYPGVYVAGREVADATGQLKSETTLHAGEDYYTAYDSSPRRWGDYTGMTIDPDGRTFWYVGEYSRNQATARWSTWVGSFTWSDCTGGGPTPTPGPSPTPTNTPVPPTPTPAPDGQFCSTGAVTIPDPGSTTSNITVTDGRSISDLNVTLDVDHTWVGDLTFTLTHNDTGTTVTLVDRPGVPASTYGCSGDDILATLDDEAALAVEDQCAGSVPTINGTFRPTGLLSAFDGQAITGSWTLTASDAVSPDPGTVNEWCLVATLGDVVPTPTPTPVPAGEIIYVSSTTSGTAGGVSFNDEDILSYNTGSGGWAMIFDGSDVAITTDVDAFSFLADGSLLMSFDTTTTVTGLGSVADVDIVRFIPTSLGSTTAGTFEWYFDGSDVGLSTSSEDIDALALLSNGNLVISTLGGFTVTGASGADEDFAEFAPTSLGATTAGTWTFYFDGSDVGLTSTSEDVNGTWIDSGNGDIYLTTTGTFSVTGASGTGTDIFLCDPGTLGSTTTCTYTLYWDGSANGYGSEILDGFDIDR